MKIKVKIHTFASDTDNGTNCEVFATEAELHKHLRRIMEDDAEENQTLSGLLSDNKIDEAWDYWTEHCAGYLDTFNVESHTVEVEVPEIASVIQLISNLINTADDTGCSGGWTVVGQPEVNALQDWATATKGDK